MTFHSKPLQTLSPLHPNLYTRNPDPTFTTINWVLSPIQYESIVRILLKALQIYIIHRNQLLLSGGSIQTTSLLFASFRLNPKPLKP